MGTAENTIVLKKIQQGEAIDFLYCELYPIENMAALVREVMHFRWFRPFDLARKNDGMKNRSHIVTVEL